MRSVKDSIGNLAVIAPHAAQAESTTGEPVNVALLNFTTFMATTGMQQGVRVNAINPGLVATDRFTRNVERVMGVEDLGCGRVLGFLLSFGSTTQVA